MKPMKKGLLAGAAEHDESAEAPEQESAETPSMQQSEGDAEPESHESAAMESSEQEGDGDGGMKNPAYRKARELMLSKLYEEGAAQGIAQALSQAPNIAQGIVDQSMALGQVMDDATQGSVPDDLVMSFMLDITQEVVDIANASGIQVQPADMAQAVQEVLAQTIEAFGGDASQVRQEMGSMDPAQVGQAAIGGGNG